MSISPPPQMAEFNHPWRKWLHDLYRIAFDVDSINGNYSFRNKIINGNFDFWDYATSQTSSGYGSDNRWNNVNVGSTKTTSRQTFTLGQTDVPNNPTYYKRTVVTSVAGASNQVQFNQAIENVCTLSGKTVKLSFYAKADSSKNIAIEFEQYFGAGGSPSSVIQGINVTTCALTTSWQKFTITSSLPSISGKTLGTDGNDFLKVRFWFDAGSDFNSRTNSLGQQSGTFDIAQVQLEEGSVATVFEQRPLAIERELCQRYLPIFNSTSTASDVAQGGFSSSSAANVFFIFNTFPRVPPTGITVSNVSHFTLGNNAGTSSTVTALNFTRANNNCSLLSAVGTGTPYTGATTANLFANSASGQIIFTGCEL